MSVYNHDYRPFTGRVTPRWMRIVVLARYGAAEAWSSKITVGLFVLSLLPLVIFLIGIYLANNPLARALIFKGNSASSRVVLAFIPASGISAVPARLNSGFLPISSKFCWML